MENWFIASLANANPVLLAVACAAFGVVGALLALTRRRLIFAGIGAVPLLIVVAMWLAEPPAPPVPPKGSAPQDISGVCQFKSRYEQNRTIYGEPVGSCGMREGLLTCPFTYAYMVCHQDIKDDYWRLQIANLGDMIRRSRGIPEDRNAVIPGVVAGMLASEQAKTIDILAVYGYPRTNPILEGERFIQYWDKTILTWPANSTDPAEVKRERTGIMVWQAEHGHEEAIRPNPWTEPRKLLIIVAVFCAVVSFLPMIAPGIAAGSEQKPFSF